MSAVLISNYQIPHHNIRESDPPPYYHWQEEQPEVERTYWHLDEAIGEGRFFEEQVTIRLKSHISEEQYHRAGEMDEIVPLHAQSGTRIYVMARPYILEPDYRISIGLYDRPTQEGAIGEVTSADWVGMRQQEVGQAQAWLYPQEHILVLWECFIEDRYRKEDPRADENLKSIWLGFERFLLRHLPQQVDRIATPSWEPLYEEDKEVWPAFLEAAGYSRVNDRTYAKEILRER